MDDLKKSICCGCTTLSLVGIAVLAFFSFSSLDANEYGLNYSGITKTIDKQVFTSGYHFLGFGHGFIKFQSTV